MESNQDLSGFDRARRPTTPGWDTSHRARLRHARRQIIVITSVVRDQTLPFPRSGVRSGVGKHVVCDGSETPKKNSKGRLVTRAALHANALLRVSAQRTSAGEVRRTGTVDEARLVRPGAPARDGPWTAMGFRIRHVRALENECLMMERVTAAIRSVKRFFIRMLERSGVAIIASTRR